MPLICCIWTGAIRGLPLIERKRLLKEVLKPNNVIRYSEDFNDGKALFEAAKQQGVEEIIGKKASSFYESRRSGDWVKYKIHSSDSFLCADSSRASAITSVPGVGNPR